MRTAGRALPPTVTWPTPCTCDSFCPRIESETSYNLLRGSTSERTARIITGESAGLIFRQNGRLGRFAGNWPWAALMAACTSRPAASMSRFKSNCSVIDVEPAILVEVISVTPAIRPNWRSSGVATDEAMVDGLAPGRLALTDIVGNSTCGSGATGRKRYAIAPASNTPKVRSEVAIGRLMKGSEILMIVAAASLSIPLRQSAGVSASTGLPTGGEPVGAPAGRRRDTQQASCTASAPG